MPQAEESHDGRSWLRADLRQRPIDA